MTASSPAFEIGLYSFVEHTPDPSGGQAQSPAARLKDLLEEIELADQVGLDVYGIGEHHRHEFLVSSPAVVLAAAAVRSERIRLSSAVTVLSSDDPVRVFQDFATLDLLSNGRAEIMAGRGSFIESFPLFGFDLEDYDALFSEKLELLLKLRQSERITWSGQHRAAIHDLGVYPRPVQDTLPVWIAVGGTAQSAVRAGSLGLPMALAIIGGMPERFAPIVQLYREAGLRAEHAPETLRVSINSHTFLADNAKQAGDTFYPSYAQMMNIIGRERGWSGMTRAQFDALCGPRGALLVGDAAAVTEKILFEHELFGHQRFLAQLTVGSIPHKSVMRAIELLGGVVAPAVRQEISKRLAAGKPVINP